MQIITLYRYVRPDGGVTVSITKPDVDCTERFRLIAEEGKMLSKDGVSMCHCTDVESAEGWYEVDTKVDEYRMFKEGRE